MDFWFKTHSVFTKPSVSGFSNIHLNTEYFYLCKVASRLSLLMTVLNLRQLFYYQKPLRKNYIFYKMGLFFTFALSIISVGLDKKSHLTSIIAEAYVCTFIWLACASTSNVFSLTHASNIKAPHLFNKCPTKLYIFTM